MLNRKNLDELNPPSREFYERALLKMSLSIIFGAWALFFLGLCCAAGGNAAAYNSFAGANYIYDKDACNDLKSGYGFACFCYLLSFFVCCAVSIYLSPLLIGSKLEAKILQNPQDIDNQNTHTLPQAEPIYTGYPDPHVGVNKI